MLIVNAVVLLGVLGLIFGMILDFASKKFAVEVDPKEAEVLEVLPGANCGGCGFPGCGGLAAAIAKGEAPVNGCPVGGAGVAEKVAAIMGVDAGSGEKLVANVRCKGTCEATKNKYEYSGIQDCRAAASLIGGPKGCSYGCLGLGTCVQVCKFDAIHVIDGVAVVDEEKCVNCGKCIDICPKGLIERKPANKAVTVQCKSNDFGKAVKENCSVGCIGCGICFKECPFDAIIFENKLAQIDYDKCKQCNKCAMKCPTKVIKPKERKKPAPKPAPKPAEAVAPKTEAKPAEVKEEAKTVEATDEKQGN
ncbi:RnfABCDGE type electron transport complex subunit B [Peptostreptococcus anaerobius]|uniref:RnfABCDGE type electron transport complex subunit B n=1 Tax=Peptostreptococcus anaerobius TaxID=1261 RepID=UPI0002A2326C|nr:Fe-S cluster domain-containing protein [Peptostreptococcus anaerobius]EKX93449.1 ferredoxin [Peptostreptococcus anaerobius VPI 4330 = DSM 2949]